MEMEARLEWGERPGVLNVFFVNAIIAAIILFLRLCGLAVLTVLAGLSVLVGVLVTEAIHRSHPADLSGVMERTLYGFDEVGGTFILWYAAIVYLPWSLLAHAYVTEPRTEDRIDHPLYFGLIFFVLFPMLFGIFHTTF